MSDETVSRESMGLLASVMAASHAHTAGVANSLVRSLTVGDRRKEATLALIRQGMNDLLSGRYMPTSYALVDALYPAEWRVEKWLIEHYGPDWKNPESPLLVVCEECY